MKSKSCKELNKYTDKQLDKMLEAAVEIYMEENNIYFPETQEEVDTILAGKHLPRKKKK